MTRAGEAASLSEQRPSRHKCPVEAGRAYAKIPGALEVPVVLGKKIKI